MKYITVNSECFTYIFNYETIIGDTVQFHRKIPGANDALQRSVPSNRASVARQAYSEFLLRKLIPVHESEANLRKFLRRETIAT